MPVGINGQSVLGVPFGSSAIVVSNNAPGWMKLGGKILHDLIGNAVGVCDGVADQVEINAAIATLPATGGKVQLSNGVFIISAPIQPSNPIVLSGMGASITTIQPANGANCNGISTPDNIARDLFLTDLTLDGNKANEAAGHGILADYFKIGGMFLNGLDNVIISNWFQCGIYGATYGLHQLHATNFKIDGNGADGILVNGGGFHINTPNWFISNGGAGFANFGAGDAWLNLYCESNIGYGAFIQNLSGYAKVWAANNGRSGLMLTNSYDGCRVEFVGRGNADAEADANRKGELQLDSNIQNCEIDIETNQYQGKVNVSGIAFVSGGGYIYKKIIIKGTIDNKLYAIKFGGGTETYQDVVVEGSHLHGDSGPFANIPTSGVLIENNTAVVLKHEIRGPISQALEILGSNVKGLWPCVENQGVVIEDYSGLGLNMVPSSNLETWATPPHPEKLMNFYTFDGLNNFIDTPDSAQYTFALAPFSLIAMVNIRDATSGFMFGKWDEDANQKEYRLYLDGADKMHMVLYDETAVAFIERYANVAFTSHEGETGVLIATSDGTPNVTGLKIYWQAVRIDDTSNTGGVFLTMHDLGAKLATYATFGGVKVNKIKGAGSWFAITGKELSVFEVWELTQLLLGLAEK